MVKEMKKTYPKKLGKEPIVEAVFEVRLAEGGKYPLSAIFPGAARMAFQNDIHRISKLPIADIPAPIREAQEEMRYQPVISIEENTVFINVSDRSVIVACRLPYIGWNRFREKIIEVMTLLSELDAKREIERYSIKYVDFISSELGGNSLSSLNAELSIANKKITNETCFIRTEFNCGEYIKLVGLATNAKLNDKSRSNESGLVVDIDIIKNEGSLDIESFNSNLGNQIDKLHKISKETFFDCLSDMILGKLEPNYE